MLSGTRNINASIVQGSGLGPVLYIINASDLHPVSSHNSMNMYADDSYLVVPSDHAALIPEELSHIEEWASLNNLKLNVTKTKELIVRRPKFKVADLPPPILGVERVDSMSILGVVFDGVLSFKAHVDKLVRQGSQTLYAIKQLKAQGLKGASLWDVTRATLVSRLTYASPVWWCMLDTGCIERLCAITRKFTKQGYLAPAQASLAKLLEDADDKLFADILNNPHHVLHRLLPPKKQIKYDLRKRPHDHQIPLINNSNFKKSFINKMLAKDSY